MPLLSAAAQQTQTSLLLLLLLVYVGLPWVCCCPAAVVCHSSRSSSSSSSSRSGAFLRGLTPLRRRSPVSHAHFAAATTANASHWPWAALKTASSSSSSSGTRLWVRKFINLRDPDEPRPEVFDVRFKDTQPKVEVLALKVEMTCLFTPDGRSEPATLLQVLPATIVQFLEFGKALVSYDDPLHSHRFVRRSTLGVLQRVGSSSSSTSSGGGSSSGSSSRSSSSGTLAAVYAQPAAEYVLGQVLDVSCLLGATHVTVQGPPKKKGFEGVMQRHGFKGGPATHGSKHHRGPGSVGAGTDPGRVLPGTRMAGRNPKKRSTVSGLLVLGLNLKTNALLVRGAVPGHSGKSILKVQWSLALQQKGQVQLKLRHAAEDAFLKQKKTRSS
ncbi:hypothetical protein Esti_005053 [Eimeria stiedai]